MYNILKRTLFLLVLGVSSSAIAQEYDVIINNGLVVDGTRNTGEKATVAIKGGKIIYVGPHQKDMSAPTVIDASGLVLAPGFVDVHNHAELTLLMGKDLSNESYIRQGVTTVVTGADGSLAPKDILLIQKYIAEKGSSTNLAVYVGHNGIRKQVMGMAQTLPNQDQLSQMKALIKEGMELGAVGLSTGLMYTPGMYSDTAEIIELAKVAAGYGGIYDSHVRNPVHALLKSYEEVIEIGEKAELPVKIGHAKLVGLPNRDLFPKVQRLINAARNKGINIVSDQYPYDGAQNMWLWEMIALPKDMMPEGEVKPSRTWVASLLNDPRKRAQLDRFNNKETTGFSWAKAVGYTSMRIVVSDKRPELIGKHISELSQELGKNEFDVIADMITNPELDINITLGSVVEENVRKYLQQPWNMVSSDGAWSDNGDMDIAHPRSTGSFPRVLGKYVRQEGLLDLSEAIYKMSSFPADFLGLEKRGYILKDYIADIAIFDPEKIIDRSDWVHPEKLSDGMIHVLIDGKLVLKNGEMTDRMIGSFVRHKNEFNHR